MATRTIDFCGKAGVFRYDTADGPFMKFSDIASALVLSTDASGEVDARSLGSIGAAPSSAEYIVAALSGDLSAERVLTGTSNQITVTFGAGTATLSTPQDIHTGASPQFTDLTLTGGDLICSTATTFNLVNTTATTVNFAGAATSVVVGAATATITLKGSTRISATSDPSLYFVATSGAAGTQFARFYYDDGAADASSYFVWQNRDDANAFTKNLLWLSMDGNLLLNGDIAPVSGVTSQNVFNTNATTINAFGAATTCTIGATTGTMTLRNSNLAISGTAVTNTAATNITWTIDCAESANFILDRGTTSHFSGFRHYTAGVAKWFTGMTTDATDNYYIKDGVGGNNALTITRSTLAVNVTNDLTVGDDLTVTGDFSHNGSGAFTTRNTAGGVTFLIQGDTTANNLTFRGYRASSNPIAGTLNFDGARGDATTPLVVPASTRLTRFRSRGYGDTGFQESAYIEFYTGAGTISDTSMPGQIQFWTAPDLSVTPALALTINENQDLLIVNELIGVDDADSFLDLNMGSGDVRLAAARDLYLDIDSDNNATGRSLIVRHNSATTLLQVEDDGDVLIPVGDLYLNDRIIWDGDANTFIDFATDLTIAGTGNVIVDIDNDASGSLAYFGITCNNGGTNLFRFNESGNGLYITGSVHTQALGQTFYVKRSTSGADANKTRGTATLVAGTITVSTTAVSTNDLVILSRTAVSGAVGSIHVTIVDATSFTINGAATDAGTFEWWIVKQS